MDQQAPVSAVRAISRHRPSHPAPRRQYEETIMRKLTVLAVTAAMLGTATLAQAGSLGRACTAAPQNQWLSIAELQSKVEALGYKVQKAKLKNACGEMYTIDKNGGKVELFVDPTNGAIIGQL
jgi:hypothetical protein